jgi:hypothetical protein
MKQIALTLLAGLILTATAAAAHQNNLGYNHRGSDRHMHRGGHTNGACPMNTNMMGRGVMKGNQGRTGPGMHSDRIPGAHTDNWRTNPSYQGHLRDPANPGK